MVITVTHPYENKGKSKTALHLAKKLANTGDQVLLIDLTCDAFLTNLLGFQDNTLTMLDVMDGTLPLEDAIVGYDNFAFAPAGQILKLIDISLAWSNNRNIHLTNALDQLEIEFDHIIIDCDSSLTFLTINALSASDAVVLPIFSDQRSKDTGTTIHLFGCEELMDQKIKHLTNQENIFAQLLDNIENGNKVLMLEQPIWTDEYLLPELETISTDGRQHAAIEEIDNFRVFLN